MAHEDEPRPRCDAGLETADHLGRILRGDRQLDLLQDDPFAALALLERRDHAAVVLRRRQDLVAGLQVDPELQRLEALRGVARDRHLFCIDPPLPGHARSHRLPLRLQDLPHGVGRGLVGELDVTLECVLYVRRSRAYTAVVEVDDAAVDLERPGDLRPEGLVRGNLGRTSRMPGQLGGDVDPPASGSRGREGQPRGGDRRRYGHRSDEISTAGHVPFLPGAAG